MTSVTKVQGKVGGRRLQRTLIIAFLLSVAAGFWWLMASRNSKTSPPPTVTYYGMEPGLSYRAAGFFVTNRGNAAIGLDGVKVEIVMNGAWKTIPAQYPIQYSKTPAPGTVKVKDSVRIEPGELTKIVVKWPDQSPWRPDDGRPWRIRLLYAKELKGVEDLKLKMHLAGSAKWGALTLPFWRGHYYRGH